jgi:hypothetical protein
MQKVFSYYSVTLKNQMTYVSVLEAQADPGIVSGSTIERKKMSTKTIYKRIALVAVAALGMGVLTSVSPASAATNTKIFCDVADGIAAGDASAPTSTNDVCNGVAGPANFVQLSWHSTNAVGVRLTISGAGATFGPSGDAKATVAANGLSMNVITADPTTNSPSVTVNTPTAGTVTVSYFAPPTNGVYGAAVETVVITVNAAAIAGGINASTSTTFLNKAATVTAATTETTSYSSTATPAGAAATPVFAAIVTLGRTAGAITGTTKVDVSLSGPGTLALSASDTDPLSSPIATGRSLTSTVTTTGEVFTVGVAPDGFNDQSWNIHSNKDDYIRWRGYIARLHSSSWFYS